MYWHTQVCAEVAKQFDVEVEKGLPSVKVAQRLEKYGPNKLAEKKGISLLGRFLRQFKDFMVIILLIAAVVSLALNEIVDGSIILLVVVLNAVLGVVQENRAEKALDALKKLSVPQAKVLRDGKRTLINSEELVPGDIIFLEAGDIVPADARLIEAASLKVEESSLTGESVPVEKEIGAIEKQDTQLGDRKNMVFSSCTITYGRGTAIVTETGMDTQVGHIANLLLEENEQQTPLQVRLAQIGKFLGITALVICVVIFLLGILEGKGLFEMFMTAVALAVAAIPEGMPAIVTIVLAIGVQRMVKHNAIIRRLQAVETLGSASVICSDKTGTLTQNRMTVMECYTDGKHIKPDAADKDTVMNLLVFASMCNDARAEEGKDGVRYLGDPTETALVAAAYGLGIKKSQLDVAYPRVGEVPFDSARKLMSTIHAKDSQYYVVTKGAPDVLLSRCEFIAAEDGFVPLSPEERKKIEQANTAMASKALRVLAVAVRDLAVLPEHQNTETIETSLVFVGLIGMIDPPREEVKEAVKLCRRAGIKPVMITGDHVDTAIAIAKQLGILKNIDEAITGSILDGMSELELGRRIRDFSVFARVSPEHKVRIVKAWRDAGEIVAMTGDGVNDAPALNAADIGCAMGITGTDVAKGAAHMVLADDNFATIVSAVREGRGIYSNIRKSIQFLLSSNFGEIVTILFAMIFRWDVPLLPIHLLWVNLVTDSLPALSLGVDTVEPTIMEEKPRPKNEGVFAGGLGMVIVLQGLLIGTLTLIAFWLGRYKLEAHGLELGQTMAFAVLSIAQLFHAYNVRSRHSVFKIGAFTNRYLNGSFLISFGLQLLLISVPFLAGLFSLVPLSLGQWLWVLLFAAMPVVVVELAKLILSKLRKR